MAYKNINIRSFLPDLISEKKQLNREYLFNVSVIYSTSIHSIASCLLDFDVYSHIQIVNSVMPSFFEENIRNGYKQRKENEAEKKQRKFEVTTFMYKLITSSNHLCTGNHKHSF